MTATAVSTSPGVVILPVVSLSAPRAHSSGTFIALRTEDMLISPEWQAAPAAAATLSWIVGRKVWDSIPNMLTFNVFGRRNSGCPFNLTSFTLFTDAVIEPVP